MNIKKQAFLNTLGNTVYLFTLWFLTVIATQLLGYEAVGKLTLAMAIGNIVILFQLYGVRGYQSSDVSFAYSPNTYLRTRFITVIGGIILSISVSFLLGYSKEFIVTLLLFVLFRSSEAFADVLHGDDQRMGKLQYAGYSLFLRGIVTGILFFAGAYFYHDLNVALFFIAIGNFFLTIVIDYPLYSRVAKPFFYKSSGRIEELLKSCLPLLITTLVPAIVFAVPRIVLAEIYGAELLGYYGNISTPSLVLTTLIPNILIAFFPKYGKLIIKSDYQGILRLWLKSLAGTILISGACVIGATIFGKSLLSIVYTEEILPYFHFLIFIFFAMTIYAFEICNATVLIAMRENKVLTFSSLLALIVSLTSSTFFVRNYGINGAIAVLVASYSIQIVVQVFRIARVCVTKKSFNC